MTIDILTLFPDSLAAVLNASVIGNGIKKGYLAVGLHQIRDFTTSKQARVDDAPYGGGMGMVMQADPLANAHMAVLALRGLPHIHTVLMSAGGKVFTQKDARRLACMDNFILVCGHYEGVDQRFVDECVDEELSVGDFVMTGGEIPALAVADAVGRLIPGVLADESCFTDESHWSGLLEYPQYTRPDVWNGRQVPPVLTSGNREAIRKWRKTQSLLKTRDIRPDMFECYTLSREDKELLEKSG